MSHSLLAYEADDETGQLRFLEAQQVTNARRLGADRRGRFVYVAGWPPPSYCVFVSSYAVDAASGRLHPRAGSAAACHGLPLSLATNERQVYAVAGSRYTGDHGGWAALEVDPNTGDLWYREIAPRRRDPQFVVADPEGRFVYTLATDPALGFGYRLFVSAVLSNGRLEEAGSLPWPHGIDPAVPIWSGGVVLVADKEGGITPFVVDESTGRLLPRPRLLGLFAVRRSGGAPSLATSGSDLLAVSGESQIQIYVVTASGDLVFRHEVRLPTAPVTRNVAFHPSGRFLYSSCAGEGLRVFALTRDDSLVEIGRDPRGGGAIVSTAPPS